MVNSQLSIMPRLTVSLIECSCDVRLHIAGRGDENLLDPKGATTVDFDDVHGTCTLVCSHLDSHLDRIYKTDPFVSWYPKSLSDENSR